MFVVFITALMGVLFGVFTDIWFISSLIMWASFPVAAIAGFLLAVKIWFVNFSPFSILFDIFDFMKK